MPTSEALQDLAALYAPPPPKPERVAARMCQRCPFQTARRGEWPRILDAHRAEDDGFACQKLNRQVKCFGAVRALEEA